MIDRLLLHINTEVESLTGQFIIVLYYNVLFYMFMLLVLIHARIVKNHNL